MNLGPAIRAKRERSTRYSAAEVARRVGLSPARMVDIETIPADVRIGTVARLAEFYQVPVWELLAELMGDTVAKSAPRFRSRVLMEQFDGGEIVLREDNAAAAVIMRFVPVTKRPGRWMQIEKRAHGPDGVREVVALRDGPAAKDAPAKEAGEDKTK